MDEYQAFEDDVKLLVETLRDIFEAESCAYHIDLDAETLYIQIAGLEEYENEEIAELAEEVLEELYMDFEEIVLMPLS
jgi:hypothetical protein